MSEIARYSFDPDHPTAKHWCEILPSEAFPHWRFEGGSDEAAVRARVAAYNDGSVLKPEDYEAKLAELTKAAGIDLAVFRREREEAW